MLQSSPEGKLEREQVRLIVYQMVKALAFMHSKNVHLFYKFKGCTQRYKTWEHAALKSGFTK
jgi:hypothetical protein